MLKFIELIIFIIYKAILKPLSPLKFIFKTDIQKVKKNVKSNPRWPPPKNQLHLRANLLKQKVFEMFQVTVPIFFLFC